MSSVLTVAQVNSYIKNLFVRDGVLGRICIKGEVSNCKYHSSGHIYFSLKDATSQISCAMFYRDRMNGLDFKLENGQEVEVTGSVSVYERDGNYSLYAKSIKLGGTGALYIKYLELKEKLYKEGLFDPAHKKPIPAFIKTLGIVTGGEAAALHDMINVSKRRNPYVQLIQAPAKVQGEGAALSISKALKRLDAYGVDVIIVGRGGGSIEDLWAFNEEIVVRTVYDLKTPVISAVGHEINSPLVDFASDLRAPTPSAAAELAVYDYKALMARFVDIHADLLYGVSSAIERAKKEIADKKKMLEYLSPANMLKQKTEHLDRLQERMNELIHRKLDETNQKLDNYAERMEKSIHKNLDVTKNRIALNREKLRRVSPLEKIASGYGYVSTDEAPLLSIEQVDEGDNINVTLKDGTLDCSIIKKTKNVLK